MPCVFHITRFNSTGIDSILEEVAGSDFEAAFEKASDRLQYWWAQYPSAYIGITRKA